MEPLANHIRPLSLDESIGQTHLIGEGQPIRPAIEQGHIFSFVLLGTPRTGKTTWARICATAINAGFYELSAVSAGKEDIRLIITRRLSNVARAFYSWMEFTALGRLSRISCCRLLKMANSS